MYAFVDVEDYQKVVVTDASLGISEAARNYTTSVDFGTNGNEIVKTIKIKNAVAEYALVFIAIGGVGNCIDRISLGYVVDMFEFTFINFAIFIFCCL